MGMDVFGNDPTEEVGVYFRRNIWHWHPLAELCLQLAPAESASCKHWHSNDGDGLNGEQSVLLAQRLQQLVDEGVVENYIAQQSPENMLCTDLLDVTEFIAFLRACGGFCIT